MKPKNVYEILVPCIRNNGRPIKTRCHKEWDNQVMKITGGLSILKPLLGKWDGETQRYTERMIPVRIICNTEQFSKIMKLTLKYYDQEAICGWLISSEAFILHKDKR